MTEDDIMYQLQMLREEALLEAHSDAETSQAGSTQQDATPAEAEKPPLTAAQKEEIFRASKHEDTYSQESLLMHSNH
jgi:hypothetical protein